jgi:hypothetical protein
MSASKDLPARPSLESLRKQAKKLARDVAADDAQALERVRHRLPNVVLPLTQRNAQLVIAREYGFAGWQDLTAEVSKRVGNGLEWAAAQAKRAIHDNDVERLKQLLAEHPALLSWLGDKDKAGLMGMATGAYGDAFGEERERWFTRRESAELLIDAGAVVTPSVVYGLLQSRATGLLDLFRRKGRLPHTLEFHSALGDLEAVRSMLTAGGVDGAIVNQAFVNATRFHHEAIALLLLERAIELHPDLGRQVDGSVGRLAFVRYLIEKGSLDLERATAVGPWNTFILSQARNAAQDNDVGTFTGILQREPWLLGEPSVWFQNDIIVNAAMLDHQQIIVSLLDRNPAILRQDSPPRSIAMELAVTYAHTHLMPLLTRIWPLPDDLPYAAGLGDLTRVKRWFDDSGAPALGNVLDHYPHTDNRTRGDLGWDPPTEQQVLDVALAFAVINHHFDVADFLLEHGADINTNWNSHEPASILHHLVFEDDYEAMRYLIDRGIDLTITDHRWNSTAWGWALYGKHDEKMAAWLKEAEYGRTQRAGTQ